MPSFHIQCRATVRSRTYATTIVLSSKELGLPTKCWTVEQWKFLATASSKKPLLTADIRSYLMVLQLLVEDETKQILSLSSHQVGRKEIIRLFTAAEHKLSTASESLGVQTRASSIFRKIITDYARHQSLKEEISRGSLSFQTKLSIRPGPRELISDVSNTLAPSDLSAPVAALAHRSIHELMSKTEARLGFDLEAIRKACITELTACAAVRMMLTRLGKHRYSKRDIALGTKIIGSGKSVSKEARMFQSESTPEFMLGLFQKLIVVHRLAYLDRQFAPIFWGANPYLATLLTEDQRHIRSQQFRILYLPQRIISNELIAAFVLLLIYTGWNGMSLLNMTTDQIDIGKAHVTIQGYKSKTDDHTPKVFLDSSHSYAGQAVKLLLWNRRQLIEFGFIGESDLHLWFTWTSGFSALKYQYIGFQNALENFQKQYALPKFSLDQIRTQTLAYQSLKTRDPEYVRRLAGHKSLDTTGHYLDQLIFYRLNQAINLEFQRRLENTVKFRLSQEDEYFLPLVEDRYVDLKLLMPLGDGASCANPWVPPDRSYLSGNICDGKHCHLGDGCENRKVVLDRARIQELVRKRLYYLRNWARLEANNRRSFEKYHIPAILFTLGLYDYVKSGRHRHILDKIEEEIMSNEATI